MDFSGATTLRDDPYSFREDKLRAMIATYGHGTENDFVLVFDPSDEHSITTAQTAAICNRESGIGADGLIRIIKRDDKWFMDYRPMDLLRCAEMNPLWPVTL